MARRRTLNPRPRNFTQPTDWNHGYRVTDIFSTTRYRHQGLGHGGL